MKINALIVGFLLSALLGLQGWTLTAVVDLKVQLAGLKAEVTAMAANKTQTTIVSK